MDLGKAKLTDCEFGEAEVDAAGCGDSKLVLRLKVVAASVGVTVEGAECVITEGDGMFGLG